MKMNRQVLTLIESDIIHTKLLIGLKTMGIDSSTYATDLTDVVFDLMKIRKSMRSEIMYRKYFDLIQQGKNKDLSSEREAIKKLACRVYRCLLSCG